MIQSRPNELRADEPESSLPGNEPQDRLKQHTDDVRQMAGGVREKAGAAASQAGEKLREVSRQAKDQALERARDTTAQAKERASTAITQQKDRIADEVGVISQALHRAADTLDENSDQAVGRYVHKAADLVDSCANWLRHKDATDMLRGCGNFTRRHPEVVLGGMFLAGVALARFLKASERNRDREFSGGYDFERDYGYMDTGRGLESEDYYGYRDSGYGDVGMYAGSDVQDYGRTEPFGATGSSTLGSDVSSDADFGDEVAGLAPFSREDRGQRGDADLVPDLPREEASLTRNTDIPDVTSPQPGSYPPVTPSGTFFESTAGQADKTNPAATQDKDLNRSGDACDTNPNKAR
jgi:F0F1-type ATP synthase membrane subunit b/b'